MSVLLAGTVGILVAVAVLQLLQRDAARLIVGLYITWNALNLLLIALARPMPGTDGQPPTADPLLQALTLTAIVVTFGFVAFLLVLLGWLGHAGDSIDLDDFRESRE